MLKLVGVMKYRKLKALCNQFESLGCTINEHKRSLTVVHSNGKIILSAIWVDKSAVSVRAIEGLIIKE